MTNVLLMFLLSVLRVVLVASQPSCPASCVVCSEDAIICHRLAHIIDAPDSTVALLLTEGSISTVLPASLSDLSNITVIGLSHNRISVLGEKSFKKLPFLHTLLLDHNLLTSQALQAGALVNLTQLEVLSLGHNRISMIQGAWLKGSRALRSLKLEGNLLTSLDSGSFPLNDLKDLESLDLSDNLIDHLDGNSFNGLISLHTLDLSRNRLRSSPSDAFSYLSWLTNLNLDLNTWNCSCQLLELAAFLSNFMQQPDKTLYNGRRMVCVSADNPAVSTVLELTEANCVPSNQNITVEIETRDSVTPQVYARDLAITAVICFIGGVFLTLLVVLIYYHVHRRKKLRDRKRQKEEEEGSSTVIHHRVTHLDVSEKTKDLTSHANSSQYWERDNMTLETRPNGCGGQFRSTDDGNSSHFRCPDCSNAGQRGTVPNLMKWNNRINGGMELDEEREKRRMRTMTEEERRRLGIQQAVLGKDVPGKHLFQGNTNSSSHLRKDMFSQRPETLQEVVRGNETAHCESCHRTYRAPEQNTRNGRNHTNGRDSALFEGLSSQYRQADRSRNPHHNQFELMKDPDFRRETRNVTFDLQRSRNLKQGSRQDRDDGGEEASEGKERGRRSKAKLQSSRLLKVKLNLNPLRKSKVSPKRRTEQGIAERSSPKKSKDRRYEGKDKHDSNGKQSSSRKSKGGSEKMKKSPKAKESVEESAEANEGESGEEKSSMSSSSKKGQKNNKVGKSETKQPENSAVADSTNTGDQTGSAVTMSLQSGNGQYHGAGSGPGGSHPPLFLSTGARSQTTHLYQLGPAGSGLTGSSLSLQGGSLLGNTVGPRSTALVSSSLTAPNRALSGPSMAPGGAPGGGPDSFTRPVGGASLVSSATSLQANTVYANPLQPSAIQTFPPQNSQPALLAPSLTVTQAVTPATVQNHPLVDSSPGVAGQKSDPVLGPGLQTVDGVPPLATESQVPQAKEILSLPKQAAPSVDTLSLVTPKAPGAGTAVESLSSQVESVHLPAGPEVEGLSVTGGLAAMVSEGSMQTADVTVPEQAVSAPTGDAGAALLQQEYLSEEGGSSPRRKLRLVIPEKTSSRPPTALERKIR